VATVGINSAANAALLAARILALGSSQIKERLENYISKMAEAVKNQEINKGI